MKLINYVTVKISIDNYEAIEYVIASLIADNVKITKKAIIDSCKLNLSQSGLFFNNFPNEGWDDKVKDIFCDEDKKIKEIFNKYFK